MKMWKISRYPFKKKIERLFKKRTTVKISDGPKVE
jgi:hypothetical protein